MGDVVSGMARVSCPTKVGRVMAVAFTEERMGWDV